MSDIAAMTALGLRYARAIDRCDADLLLAIFTADGSVGNTDTTDPDFIGHDALRQMVGQVDAMFIKTLHKVHNQLIEHVPGTDSASGETYCTASHVLPAKAGGWQVFDMAIRYQDSFRKEAGDWKFAARRLEVEWVEIRPIQPFDRSVFAQIAP
ncbi:MAG: nuclear transport factor 2 family protein [Polymorphobacter sp.]